MRADLISPVLQMEVLSTLCKSVRSVLLSEWIVVISQGSLQSLYVQAFCFRTWKALTIRRIHRRWKVNETGVSAQDTVHSLQTGELTDTGGITRWLHAINCVTNFKERSLIWVAVRLPMSSFVNGSRNHKIKR